ncbi:VOC family protein [Anaerolineales bacterium]
MTVAFQSQITFLYTSDLKQSVDFYENILGLRLVVDQGVCKIYETSQAGYLGFCTKAELPADLSMIILTLITDEVDDWYETLSQQGVICENKPKISEAYGVYHFFFRDPMGYRLEIQKFLDPNWRD